MDNKKILPLIIALACATVILAAASFLLLEQSNDSADRNSGLASETSENSASESSETESSASEGSTSESSDGSESSGSSESELSAESSDEASQSSESAADSSDASESRPPQAPESSSSSSQPPQLTEGEVDTSGFSYPDKVPLSAEVDNSWFDDALFIGDSITEGIKAYSLLANAEVLSNVGIGLYNIATREVINTGDGTRISIPQAAKQFPDKSKIYILIGVNGLDSMGLQQFRDLYGSFIDIIRSGHPNADIYTVSIFPIAEQKFYANGYPTGITNKKIDEFNHELMKLSGEKNVHFLYVAEAIKEPDGSLAEAATGDGMHIGPNYYEKWFAYMRTHTAK